jgi:hypothetical protein
MRSGFAVRVPCRPRFSREDWIEVLTGFKPAYHESLAELVLAARLPAIFRCSSLVTARPTTAARRDEHAFTSA